MGGKGGGSAPEYPDPNQVAKAQAKYGKETAIWNSALNNVNQITPYGSLTYSLGSTTQAPTASGVSTQTQSSVPAGNMVVAPDGRVYDTSARNFANDVYQNSGSQYYDQAMTVPAMLDGGDLSDQYQQLGWRTLGPSTATSGTSGRASGGTSSQWGDLPQWTSTVNLSPEMQAIFDSQMRQQQQLGGLAENALNQVGDAYSNPYSYDNITPLAGGGDLSQVRTSAEDAIYSRLNPQFDRDYEALATRLTNQGIMPGSEAYKTEMQRFDQMKNDARMQAVLYGGTEADRLFSQSMAARQQGISELDRLRQQPLNEYLAMSGQQQLTLPQFQQYNYQGAPTPDYAGAVNNQYQSQLANYNAQQASSNNLLGSAFGLGASILGAPMSGGGSFIGNALGRFL